MRHHGRQRSDTGSLRIIGGDWRGRRLSFPAIPDLRPTSDRVRETLFNWLQPGLRDSHCLDMFAGSGALGLEALSRGAKHCTFLDQAPAAIMAIQSHLEMLKAADKAHAAIADALSWTGEPFDIVFVDPPFAREWVLPSLDHLVASNLLTHHALIYVETPLDYALEALPPPLKTSRDKKTGNVRYLLLEKHP